MYHHHPTLLFLIIVALVANTVTGASDSGKCGYPGSPAHCNVIFSDDNMAVGTVVTYFCERGFELLGPARRICKSDYKWYPEGIPFCVLNVGAGKAAMQISSEQGGGAQHAIDGSVSSFFNADTCTLTAPAKSPWWYVNLLEPYMVQLVRLDFGKPCCGANKPATIIVRVGNNRPDLGTNPICNRYTGFVEEGQPLFLPCNPPMPGAFVSVHLEVSTPSKLSICEAFVYTDQALPVERCPQFRDQPPGSTATYNGKCYIFYNRQPMKFREALAFCRSRGGTLVDESNPALQGFISWELWRRHRSDSNSQYWMGAVRDQNDRNNWKWLSGEDVTVSFWNLPGGNEDCARYDGSKGWLWSDTDCQTNLNFICQHQPKACGRPEQPPNSTMIAQSFDVGANAEYSCDSGHLLVGPTTRTCLDTGFYNEFPPVCKRIQCGYPADIPNGGYQLINGSVGYLSHVVYTCEEGYEIIGRSQLTCDIDERWNGPPPRCEAIQCEPLPQITNGKYASSLNDTSFGATIEYFCLRGYSLHGAKRLTCLASGLWDNAPPSCKVEEVSPTSSSTTVERQRPTRPTTTRLLTRPTRPPYTHHPTYTTPRIESISISEETKTSRRGTSRPIISSTPNDVSNSGSVHVPQIIVASHPQEKQVVGVNSNIRQDQIPRVNIPLSVDGERRETLGAKLNMGAIIALGAFGGFVFLAAIVTTIVILVRRNRSAKHYRHRASPDCNTVASFDSSSSESRNGLNRYYRQAWENLHESAGSKTALKPSNHSPLRRKDTLDEPMSYRSGHHRMSNEGMRDGSELVVSDVAAYPARNHHDKKRHHHHHHHHDPHSSTRHKDWSGRDRERERDSRTNHNHKRY